MTVVYYWKGGAEQGEWREALPGVWPERKTADELVADLTRAGYVAHRGSRTVGPPEGPPSCDPRYRYARCTRCGTVYQAIDWGCARHSIACAQNVRPAFDDCPPA